MGLVMVLTIEYLQIDLGIFPLKINYIINNQ
jgi:hypothetical protein